jgi:hypothetical protein
MTTKQVGRFQVTEYDDCQQLVDLIFFNDHSLFLMDEDIIKHIPGEDDETSITNRIDLSLAIMNALVPTGFIGVSSPKFEFQTGYKLKYTEILSKAKLMVPDTEVVYKPLDTRVTMSEDFVYKVPFSSSSKCVSIYGSDSYLSNLHLCRGALFGYIKQPYMSIVEEYRCCVIGGEIMYLFILGSRKLTAEEEAQRNQREEYNSMNIPHYKLLTKINELKISRTENSTDTQTMRMEDPKDFAKEFEQISSDLRLLCKQTFETVNKELELQEGFMRMDIVLTNQGKLYVNEIEPWRSRKYCIINDCSKSSLLSIPWMDKIKNKEMAEQMKNATIAHAVKCTCFLYHNRPLNISLAPTEIYDAFQILLSETWSMDINIKDFMSDVDVTQIKIKLQESLNEYRTDYTTENVTEFILKDFNFIPKAPKLCYSKYVYPLNIGNYNIKNLE